MLEIGEFLALAIGIPFLLGIIYIILREEKRERRRKGHNRTGRERRSNRIERGW